MKTVWFIRDVEGTHMKKVNLPFIYQLGAEMQALVNLEYKATGASRIDILIASTSVYHSIQRLLGEYPALTVSRKPGLRMLLTIEDIREWFKERRTGEKPDYDVTDTEIDQKFSEVISQAKTFETVLKADLLENLTAYHPQQKGIYSTAQLIAHAENAFHPQDLMKLEPETMREIRESGRCLAFDNYTASGFHMLRALERVLHEYYVFICKPTADGRLNSWAAYLTFLYELCKDDCNTLTSEDKNHVKKVYYLL